MWDNKALTTDFKRLKTLTECHLTVVKLSHIPIKLFLKKSPKAVN